jgi:hypothetical protein
MEGIRRLASLLFATGAIVQAILYLGILFEHKPTAPVVRFLFLKIPRKADLTSRGIFYARC